MPANVNAVTGIATRGDKVGRSQGDERSVTSGDGAQEWPELVGLDAVKQLEKLGEMLQKEVKIRDGAEHMLEFGNKTLRRQVESQLEATKAQIQTIQRKMDQLRDQSLPAGALRGLPSYTSNRNATKRKATAGLTFLNGNGLATPVTYASSATLQTSTSPRPPLGSISTNSAADSLSTLNNTPGILAGSSMADPSAAKRFFAPSLVPQPPTRSRSESEATDNRDDYKAALAQARGYSRALASLTKPTELTHPPNIHTGDRSPPPGASSPPGKPSSSGFGRDVEIEQARLELMTNLVQIFARNKRVRRDTDAVELFTGLVPSLGDHNPVLNRIAAYRLLRYVVGHPDGPDLFNNFDGKDLGWFIVRSLSRDSRHLAEKEQVFLLIRALIDAGSERRPLNTPAGCSSLPLKENVVRAIVSIAEMEEDTNALRWTAVEMLAEILLLDVELIYRSEGIRVLLQTMADGPPELAPVLANAFLAIIDNPRTRIFLKVGTDLEVAISNVTDAYGRGEGHVEAMKASARLVVTLLRSWIGLLYLCAHDMLAIKSLVDVLRIPNMDTREIVLDMFFEVLNIKPADWYRTFLDGRRLTMYGRQRHAPAPELEPVETYPEPERLNLVDQYLALVLAVVTDAGLLEALICMIEELSGSSSTLSRKATLLLGEVLRAANRLLPLSLAAKMQSLPKLFCLGSDYHKGQNRVVGTSTLASIDSFNRNRSRLQTPLNDSRNRANSVDDPMRRGQRQIEQVKIKMALQLDDRTFQLMLGDTQVGNRDHTKWNYEILFDLFEGPFLSGKRVEEGLRNNKFGRRLMPFWYPSSRRFSELRKTKSNVRWVKLGCLIVSTLVKTPEGARFLLHEDDLLKDLSESFAQFDPWNRNPTSDSILTKQHIEETVSYGYFEMLGQLSKTTRGMELMEHFKFFNTFYHLSDLKFREDLIKGIIENLDYTVDGHPRIVLSKALTSSYKHIRLYSTDYLGKLVLSSKQQNAWTLRLLLTQLYDPSQEVRELAVNFLEEACENRETLRVVVEMQPTLDHLGELGHPLLLKFMSTDAGFRYLYDTEYIEKEMHAWFHERNQQYVVLVEVYLSKALTTDPAEEGDDLLVFDGIAPPHFYGEMVKTELGCQVLAEKGHFSDFTHFIRQHGFDSDDSDITMKLKSVLWAVGNIGASEGGISFLEDDEIIPVIIEIADTSPVLSIRGTCFFVIGLIASTEQGAEILSDYGWTTATTALGLPTGMCIPVDIEKFMALPTWQTPDVVGGDRRLPLLKSQHERDAIEAIENLCNTVVANAASRTLAKLKSKQETRYIFSSTQLLHRALHTISTRRYRFPVRKYVLELFDIKFDAPVLAELAQHEHQAYEELKLTGGFVIGHRNHHGHHTHGTRRSRHSMKAKSRRQSNAQFRQTNGQEDEGNQPNAFFIPDSPVVVRPKDTRARVTGFEAPDQTLANTLLMQAD